MEQKLFCSKFYRGDNVHWRNLWLFLLLCCCLCLLLFHLFELKEDQ